MKKKDFPQGRLIVLSGPSGAGKTTLHELLLSSKKFRDLVVRSVSATTRKPRGNEKNGREYFFLSERMFRYKIRAGHFLEWAKVFGNYYGTPIKNVRCILESGKSVLLCIDVKGGLLIKKKIPNALMLFVTTSDIKELRRRLEKRGTDSCYSIENRYETSLKEIAQAKHYDYIIINDDLKKAFSYLSEILSSVLGISSVR